MTALLWYTNDDDDLICRLAGDLRDALETYATWLGTMGVLPAKLPRNVVVEVVGSDGITSISHTDRNSPELRDVWESIVNRPPVVEEFVVEVQHPTTGAWAANVGYDSYAEAQKGLLGLARYVPVHRLRIATYGDGELPTSKAPPILPNGSVVTPSTIAEEWERSAGTPPLAY